MIELCELQCRQLYVYQYLEFSMQKNLVGAVNSAEFENIVISRLQNIFNFTL